MRAAIYLRVSTDHEEQRLSPEHQLSTCKEYLKEIGLYTDDTLVYNDAGFSGTEIEKRADVIRLVSDARRGKFDAVVFTAISRFARDLSDALTLKKRLETLYGIRIISIEEGYDSAIDGRNSEMIFTVHAMVAAHKSQEMSKAIRRGLRQSAASGRHIGNVVPFGYQKNADKKLVPDPHSAFIVQDIFRMYLRGMGSKKIASELNRRGISPMKARVWQSSSINAILRNPVYRGDLVSNRWRLDTDVALSRQYDEKVKRQMERDQKDWVVLYHDHEAIIDEETFQMVQILLGEKGKNRGVSRSHNLLAGFMKCGNCGGAAIVRSGKKNKQGIPYKYVECAAVNRISKEVCTNHVSIKYNDVLNSVLMPLQKLSSSTEKLDQWVEVIVESQVDRNLALQIEVLNRQWEQIQLRQEKALRAFTEGIFPIEMILDHQTELKREANRIEGELERLTERLKGQNEVDHKRDELRELLHVFRSWDKFDLLTIRSALAVVMEKIEIYGDKRVSVHWKWEAPQFSQQDSSLM